MTLCHHRIVSLVNLSLQVYLLTCRRLLARRSEHVCDKALCTYEYATFTALWRRCSTPLYKGRVLSSEPAWDVQMNRGERSTFRLPRCAWGSVRVCRCAALIVLRRAPAFSRPRTSAISQSCRNCASAIVPILALLNRYLLQTPLLICAAVKFPLTRLLRWQNGSARRSRRWD